MRSFLFASLLALVVGCGTEDGPADEIIAIPFPSTIELDAESMDALEAADDDGTLRFEEPPATLDDVHVGSILVGGVSSLTPSGLLRAVLDVERDGDTLTLRTAVAPIQLAYRRLHVRVRRSMPAVVEDDERADFAGLRAALGGSFEDDQPFEYVLFDADGDEETTSDRIAAKGSIGGGFDYDLTLDVDWGDVTSLPDAVASCLESLAGVLVGEPPNCNIEALLPEARVTWTVQPTVRADATIEGAAILDFEKKIDLASTTLPPLVIGPIVLVPVAALTAEISGGASAQFTTGVHGSATFETSVTVSSRQTERAQISEPRLVESDFGPNETSVSLGAEAKVGIGARVELLLFGVTGPYAEARAFASIEAQVLEDPCWSLDAGLEAELGVKVTSPALPVIGHVTLVDWKSPTLDALEVELTSGECDAPPMSPTLPSGSGPDAIRLAEPTFTPWSRTYSSPVEGGGAGIVANASFVVDHVRTIDGHTVRAGSGVLALTKLDDDGDLVWSRELQLDGRTLAPTRARSTRGGTIAVLSGTVTSQVVLAELAQDGSLLDARGYVVPLDECNVQATGLLAPTGEDRFVSGSCLDGSGFVLHATTAGAVLHRYTAEQPVLLRIAEDVGDELFTSGYVRTPDSLFAMRLRRDGTVVYAKRYRGCDMAPDAIPSAAVVGERGEVTLAGSGGAEHNGLLVRLREDGEVGFASFPGFGFGVGSVFMLQSIVELPTTGYIAGGAAVRFTDDASDNVPSAALLGLDARGAVIWARRYQLGEEGDERATGHVGVHATDDGGALATALAVDPADPLGGALWAFKAFARDGALELDDVRAEPTPVVDLECDLEAEDLAIDVTTTAVQAVSIDVRSMERAIMVESQGP